MNIATEQRLLDINRQFYQTFAVQFSETRRRIQPGVKKIIQNITKDSSILDLGCGNGELWRYLAEHGYTGKYFGIDASEQFIKIAIENIPEQCQNRPQFLVGDLATPDWPMMYSGEEFDFIITFAVLHHLPGADLRQQTLLKIRSLLARNGLFVHSEWLFLNSPKLTGRIQDWDVVGIKNGEVDPGDYLLDWRHGGHGLRYVHAFEMNELFELAKASGFEILETFTSDGDGGNLSLYQIWSAVK